jgi:lactoylglutathione lyase
MPAPMSTSFDHVGLCVAALDAEAEFFQCAFGFELELSFELPHDTRGAMLKHPSGMRLELFERPGSVAGIQGAMPLDALWTRGYGHFALAAPEIDSIFQHALEQGARAMAEPGPSPEPGVRFAFLADPEGNLIELVERG